MSAPLFAPTEPGMSSAASNAVAQRGTPATLNLDDIFGDVMFTPDGDTVFLSELQGEGADVLASGEAQVATVASRIGPDGLPVAVPLAGGISTTQLDQDGKPALTMGTAASGGPTNMVPFQQPPQQRHHLQYATPEMMNAMKKRKAGGSKSADRKMSEQQKVERRYVTKWFTLSALFAHIINNLYSSPFSANAIANTPSALVSARSSFSSPSSKVSICSKTRTRSSVSRSALTLAPQRPMNC